MRFRFLGEISDNAPSPRPGAVLAVYPNAVITYNLFGAILRATDYELGLTVNWNYHLYAGFLGVSMAIAVPSELPPPPEPVTRVTHISMTANKTKGEPTVTAFVWVDDESWADAVGATVLVDWTFPDGSAQRLQVDTSSSGTARFEVRNARSGAHTLTVGDVVYFDH